MWQDLCCQVHSKPEGSEVMMVLLCYEGNGGERVVKVMVVW